MPDSLSAAPEGPGQAAGDGAAHTPCVNCQHHGKQCEWKEQWLECIACHQENQACSQTISRRARHWAERIAHFIKEARKAQSHRGYLPRFICNSGIHQSLENNKMVETIEPLKQLADDIVSVYESNPDRYKELADKLDNVLGEMEMLVLATTVLAL
jgi:hypothetical protein